MASKAIDHFRAILDHLDGEDRNHQLDFFQGVLAAGPAVVMELDGRLPGSRAPRALRQLAMEACFYFPWPDWVPILSRILRYESEHDIFETGARALGRIGTKEAMDALRELNTMRQGAEFKEMLAGILTQTDPQEAFDHYLSRLLEGSANPSVANEAAQRLATLVDGSNLDALRTVAMHPDLLVFRHALLLLANIRTREAAEVLADLFEDNHHEVLGDRHLKEAMSLFRAMPAPAAREKALEALRQAGAGEGLEHPPLVKAFFRDILTATEEGKPSQMAAVMTQAAEAMHNRARRLGFAVDATAEGLVAMVGFGLIDTTRVLDLLVEGYRDQTGREGLARALARMVPADATEIHRLILSGPDAGQRAAAVEVLGGRQEEALQPVLLEACRDPLTDIADRALLHLGRLPGVEDLARTLVRSSNPQDLSLGLALIAQQRLEDLVPELLELVKSCTREETTLQIIETLGKVGGPLVASHLLDMLHSGQSLRVQIIVAQSLQGLGEPEVALALCARADQIKVPLIHTLAVEALAIAHGVPERPLSTGNGPMLLYQVRKAWMDRNPWGMRLRLATALLGLHLANPETWLALGDLVRDALADKRPPGVWSPDALHLMQTAAKEFMRRGSGADPSPEA